MTKRFVAPGTEQWVSWANRKAVELGKLRRQFGLSTMQRTWEPDPGVQVWIQSTQHGDTIYITGGAVPRGFVVYFSGVDSSLPAGTRIAAVPITQPDPPAEHKALRAFPPVYDMAVIGRYIQTVDAADTITTSTKRSDVTRTGAFVDGAFKRDRPAITSLNAVAQFFHTYTDADGEHVVRLAILTDGTLVNTRTGAALTMGGAVAAMQFAAALTGARVMINEDGTAYVVECRLLAVGGSPAAADPWGEGYERRAYKVEVDFAAGTQAVVTAHVDVPFAPATVYGTKDRTESNSEVSTDTAGVWATVLTTDDLEEEISEFPVVLGVDDAGDTVSVDLLVDTSRERSYSNTASGDTGTSAFTGTADDTRSGANFLTLRLPTGETREFATWEQAVLIAASYSGVTPGYDQTTEITSSEIYGALGIIYADAAKGIVVYCYNTVAIEGEVTEVKSDVDPAGHVDGDATVVYTRRVGVFTAAGDRELFTESSDPIDVTVSFDGGDTPIIYGLAKAGYAFFNFPWVYTGAIGLAGVSTSQGNATSSSSTPTSEDITYHDRLFHRPRSATGGVADASLTLPDVADGAQFRAAPLNSTPSFSHAGRSSFNGFLQMRDVGDLASAPGTLASPFEYLSKMDWTNEPRYYVAAKDAENWIVLVHKVQDMNGYSEVYNVAGGDRTEVGVAATINVHEYYAGTLDEAQLKADIHSYLATAAASAAVPDAAFITTVEGADFGSYPVEFYPPSSARTSTLPMT